MIIRLVKIVFVILILFISLVYPTYFVFGRQIESQNISAEIKCSWGRVFKYIDDIILGRKLNKGG